VSEGIEKVGSGSGSGAGSGSGSGSGSGCFSGAAFSLQRAASVRFLSPQRFQRLAAPDRARLSTAGARRRAPDTYAISRANAHDRTPASHP